MDFIDDIFDRAQDRAERDHDRFSILGPVAADETTRFAAETLCEVGGDLGNGVEGLELLGLHQVLDLR